MISRYRTIIRWSALLTAICLMQVYVFAGATDSLTLPASTLTPSPQTGGTLRTTGSQPITVNGNSVRPGTTILSGSTLETGAGIGATIGLGSLGSVELAPNTKAVLDFSGQQIKVTVTEGCLIVRYQRGVYAEIDTAQGKVAASDPQPATAGALDVCQPAGSPSAIVNQGAAANAGAGTGAGAAAAAPAGVNGTVLAVLLGGAGAGIAAISLGTRGGNPSPSTP